MHATHTVLVWGLGAQAVGQYLRWASAVPLVTMEEEKGVVLLGTLGLSQ